MSSVAPDRTGMSLVPSRSQSFLMIGIVAVGIVEVLWFLGLLNWLPFIGNLLSQGTVGPVAALVLAVSVWVVLFVILRFLHGSLERAALDLVRVRLRIGGRASDLRDVPLDRTLIGRRLKLLNDPLVNQASVTTTAELDHALSDVSYGPVRALVWALPALGFLGTAAEMSRAVGGLGPSLKAAGNGYEGLRDALVSNVIPPLGDAFGVTLFALGASVLCHLLLTWTNSREQRILLEVEQVTLLAMNHPGAKPFAASHGPASLNGEMASLAREINQARAIMSDSANKISNMDLGQLAELPTLITMVIEQLEQIRAELSKDYVISRQSPTVPGLLR